MWKVERVTWILEIGKWNWVSGKWKVERRSGIGSRRGSGLEVKLKVECSKLKEESGKWKDESGQWKVESGKWNVECGKWKVES